MMNNIRQIGLKLNIEGLCVFPFEIFIELLKTTQFKDDLGRTHTRKSVPCPGTFEPCSPVRLTSVVALNVPEIMY